MKYSEKIRIRLTAEELAWLKKIFETDGECMMRSGRKNFSKFLRDRLLSGFSAQEKLARQNGTLRHEIRRIGVNINQVTKKINAGFGSASDIPLLDEMLKEVEETLEEYIRLTGELWESQN